jgi:hypothetical protein
VPERAEGDFADGVLDATRLSFGRAVFWGQQQPHLLVGRFAGAQQRRIGKDLRVQTDEKLLE